MPRSRIASTVIIAAALLWACGGGGGSLYHDAQTEWIPDGTGPCEGYTDTDGDTIPDSIEGDGDRDGDTIPNYLDDDSDGDTIPDAVEAGDSDLCTNPDNTDWGYDSSGNPTGDDWPDFLDLDSDNDGLSDAQERELGTDPKEADTDGDGVTDLGEVAFETDPLDPMDTMDPDDFFVVLPYNAPEHEHQRLVFGTELQVADVYFLSDTTGSMSGAIANVASSLATVIVPAVRAEIPDVQMGAGHFNDCPSGSYGGTPDEPYWHFQSITADDAAVQDALNAFGGSDFPWGGGYDGAEAHVIALWCTATGNGFTECASSVPPQSCPAFPDEPGPRRGYPCFRPESLPIIVMVSDAPWHSSPTCTDSGCTYDCTSNDFDDALTEMLGIGARFIGVHVNNWDPAYQGFAAMQDMAIGTGSVDGMGAPLVEQSEDGSVSVAIVEMIATLATATPQDVNAIPQDVIGDPPGAEYDASVFVKDITPYEGFPDAPIGFSSMDDTYFHDVVPGTQVTFDVDFYNNTRPPLESAQVFKAKIIVLGNGVARLDERLVVIIVPTEGMGEILI